MGWLPGEGNGAGDEHLPHPGAPDERGPSADRHARGAPAAPGAPRDERLAGFARGGDWDSCLPGPELAAVLADVAGLDWRCPGAEPDELIGVLRRVAALESWTSALKLGVVRELIRQDDLPALGRPRHGDLPDAWSESLNHEVALALACSVQSAEQTTLTAWELGARLPGTAALLADGTLTYGKAKLIADTFQLLGDADVARAEALLLPQLTGATSKTYGQIINLANRVAAEVDPGLAERRRKAAVQHASRVRMFREQSGAAALSGRDLPTDQTLAAYANVTARAAEYKDSGAFPGERMSQFLSTAYLDLINGMTADTRIALGYLSTHPAGPGPADSGPAAPGPASAAPAASAEGDPVPADRGNDDDYPGGEPGDGAPGGTRPPGEKGPGNGPVSGGRGGNEELDGRDSEPPGGARHGRGRDGASADDGANGGGSPGGDSPDGGAPDHGAPDHGGDDGHARDSVPAAFRGRSGGRPVLADLVVPLATLLGLAERPGEAHGLGVLDPDLCRDLVRLAAASPHTRICLTVTDPGGIAIGHGCGRAGKRAGPSPEQVPAGIPPPPVALPARVNLTITADRLAAMLPCSPGPSGASPPRALAGWALARRDADAPSASTRRPGAAGRAPSVHEPALAGRAEPPDLDWCGSWMLTLPGGQELAVGIEPVPTYECDHKHESRGYQPNDTLRHLVQVRDHTCTFPSCSRHARESDFEHCQPYHKGGRTCSCNAGARSRKCHRVKQSPGWNVTQPKPGWHSWTTPSGRTYIQAPYHYPVLLV
jgi:hypothetical protein